MLGPLLPDYLPLLVARSAFERLTLVTEVGFPFLNVWPPPLGGWLGTFASRATLPRFALWWFGWLPPLPRWTTTSVRIALTVSSTTCTYCELCSDDVAMARNSSTVRTHTHTSTHASTDTLRTRRWRTEAHKALRGVAGLERFFGALHGPFYVTTTSCSPPLVVDIQRVQYHTHTHIRTHTHAHARTHIGHRAEELLCSLPGLFVAWLRRTFLPCRGGGGGLHRQGSHASQLSP